MRQVATGIAVCLTLLLGFFGTAKAGSISGAACAGVAPTFTVNSLATAAQINGGFNCPAVFLVINFSLSNNLVNGLPQNPLVGPGPGIPVAVLNLTAKTITIAPPAGADPTDPTQRVQIVNGNAASFVTLTAVDGDILISGASIKAHKVAKFVCTEQAPPCKFTADDSDLIAATDFDNPTSGGGLFFNIFGPISIHTTNVHGGDTVEMESVSSSITMICKSGDTACKDPNIAKPDIVTSQCGDPIVFPCTLILPTKKDLTDVCIGAAGVVCNGGHKEKRFTAGTFINFTGSTITSDEHVTFTCKGINFPAVPNSGDLMASGATFDMDSLVINCKGKIDLSKSRIVMAAHLTVNSGTNCPAGAVCIDVSGATPDPATCPLCGITAKPIRLTTGGGGGRIVNACNATFTVPVSFPVMNGGTSPTTYNEALVLFKPYTINGAPVVDPPDNCPVPPGGSHFIQ